MMKEPGPQSAVITLVFSDLGHFLTQSLAFNLFKKLEVYTFLRTYNSERVGVPLRLSGCHYTVSGVFPEFRPLLRDAHSCKKNPQSLVKPLRKTVGVHGHGSHTCWGVWGQV